MPIPARGDCHFRVRRLQSPRAALTEITTHLIFFRYFCQNFPVVLCVLLLFLYLCSAKGSKSYRMTLRELNRGQSATILKVGGEGALRQHFLDMGMIPGAQVTLQKFAPLGDPMELRVHGYELTLRLADAEQIEVTLDDEQSDLSAFEDDQTVEICHELEHPGFGEEGRYHDQDAFHPISSAKKGPLTFALVGNQTARTASSRAIRKPPSPTSPASTASVHIQAKKSSAAALSWRAIRAASSTSSMPPTSSATSTLPCS